MLTRRSGRKAKHPIRIRILVRQPAFSQPVKDAVKRDTVDHRLTERQLDLVVRQRCGSGTQQLQNPDTRGRRTRTSAADLLGDCFSTRGSRFGQESDPDKRFRSLIKPQPFPRCHFVAPATTGHTPTMPREPMFMRFLKQSIARISDCREFCGHAWKTPFLGPSRSAPTDRKGGELSRQFTAE